MEGEGKKRGRKRGGRRERGKFFAPTLSFFLRLPL